MKPLEGITVLDFTQFTAGPVCTYILADFGAEVISLQNPPSGDNNHYVPPHKNKQSVFIASLKHSKKNVMLNLKDERQKAIFMKMVKTADVVIDNFKAGTLNKFGITYEMMKEVNPKIVWTTMAGYGEVSPWRNRPAYDMAIQAGSGMMSVTGQKGGSPLKAGVSMADFTSGLNSAICTMSAVFDAKRTGKGRFIDLAMLDGALTLVTDQATKYLLDGEVAKPNGAEHRGYAPYGIFEDKNGVPVTISVRSDKEFAALCDVLGCSEMAQSAEYKKRIDRVANRTTLEGKVSEFVSTWDADDLCNALENADVACSKILNLEEVCASDQAKARKMLMKECRYPDGTTFGIVGMPTKLSTMEEPESFFGRPLGVDTIEVLSKYEDPAIVHEIFDPIVEETQKKWAERTASL